MNPLSKYRLKKLAKEAWASAYKARNRSKRPLFFGVGPVAQANWFAGYAAAMDWAAQMAGKRRAKK